MKVGNLSLTSGRSETPKRFIVYGPGSVGKTTLALSAPNPMVISCEDGAREFDAPTFRFAHGGVTPRTLTEVEEALKQMLAADLGDRKTLVVDGFHQLDHLVSEDVLKRNPKWSSIQTAGFGVGEAEVLRRWRAVVDLIEQVNTIKQMRIIMTGHSQAVKFKDPEGSEFDRYDMQVTKHPKGDVAGFLFGWADVVGFAKFDRLTLDVGPDKRQRTVAVAQSGDRTLNLSWTNAWQAKCRIVGAPASVRLTHDDGAPKSWAEVFGGGRVAASVAKEEVAA